MASENNRCFAWCVRLKQSCNERWARFRNRFRRRFYSSRGQSLDQSAVLNETGTPDMVLNKVPLMANKVAPYMAQGTAVKEIPAVNSVTPTDADKDFDKLVEDYVSAVILKAAGTLISHSLPQTPDNGKFSSADDNVRVFLADNNRRVISAGDNATCFSADNGRVTSADDNVRVFLADNNRRVISAGDNGTCFSADNGRITSADDNGRIISTDDNGMFFSAEDNGRAISADDNVSLTSSIISQMADSAVTESLTNIVTENDRNQSATNGHRPRTVKEFIEMFGLATLETAGDGLTPISC